MIEWIKTHNVASKAVALLVAMMMWLYVMSMEKPTIDQPYSGIPVYVKELKGDFVILEGANTTVTVTVQGPSDIIKDINRDKLEVSLNASGITAPGEYNLAYSVSNIPLNVTQTNVYPSRIKLKIDRVVSKAVPVVIDWQGELPDNLLSDAYRVSPEYVTLEGPESYLESVDRAVAHFDRGTVTDKVDDKNLTFELVDGDGQPIAASRLALIKADVTVVSLDLSIKMEKLVPLKAAIEQDMGVVGAVVDIQPAQVTLVGLPSSLDGINQIALDPVNLKSLIESGNYTLEREIPIINGATIKEEHQKVTVTVTMPDYGTRVVTVTQEAFTIGAGYTYPEQSIDITVFGKNDDIAGVGPGSFAIVPQFTADQLPPGEHILPAGVVCSINGITVIGKQTITVIIDEPQVDPAEPTEPENPAE